MSAPARGGRPGTRSTLMSRALRWFEYPAHLAVLNLCWLLASLPLITSYAAGIALHSALRAWREEGENRVAAYFFRECRRVLRGSLPLAAAGLVSLLGLWLSGSFWLGAPGPLLVFATAALVPVAIVVAAVHITVFEVAARHPQAPPRDWVLAGLRLAVTRPGRCACAVLLCATWGAVLWRLPTLAALWGISVPALVLHRLFAGVPTGPGWSPSA
ncbi:DUF624 domain-containing protein [Streptomyces sp. NPDC059679]|uniref:DUF624 domain-containing protein n=1 Tax=Streptomyces sp. NPDC059679 TaxID=3346903 RepID=UPI0036A7B9B7